MYINLRNIIEDTIIDSVEAIVREVAENIGDYIDITDYVNKCDIAETITDRFSNEISDAIDCAIDCAIDNLS